jgi:protein-S-isoprenylcysteine O-methyltransferase Ste14
LLSFGSALLLSSLAGLGAAIFLTLMVVMRIFGEEQVLARGLNGYPAYRQKVRFRLVPHVW